MKKLLLLSCILISLNGLTQYDTGYIRNVYKYLNSNECKSAIVQLSEQQTEKDIKEYPAIRKRAKAYRQQQRGHALFWTFPGKCFVPDTIYFIPDTTSGEKRAGNDSIIMFRKFISKTNSISIPATPGNDCTERLITRFYYLSPQIAEVHYFYNWADRIKFGYEDILQFKVDKNGAVQLLSIGGIHHN